MRSKASACALRSSLRIGPSSFFSGGDAMRTAAGAAAGKEGGCGGGREEGRGNEDRLTDRTRGEESAPLRGFPQMEVRKRRMHARRSPSSTWHDRMPLLLLLVFKSIILLGRFKMF